MEKNKLFELSLFIFRRDLRLVDNTGLLLASKLSKNIIPAFFLDNRQVDKTKNPYHSSNSIQFMCESLSDLNIRLKELNSMLFVFHGDLIRNLEDLIKNTKINSIFVNQDYTPFAIKRDEEIKKLCDQYNIKFNSSEDLLLTDLHSVKTKAGTFSKIFTPYCRAASLVNVPKVSDIKPDNFIKDPKIINSIKHKLDFKNESDLFESLKLTPNKNLEIKGGRKYGEEKLKNLKTFGKYEQTRNFPIISSTRLSAYLKFGIISVREVFHLVKDSFGGNHDLIKQLHWRDFYTKISFFYPHVIGHSMKENLDKVEWLADEKHIEAWKNGKTGCPIVDSAMRCLNTTGFMHNRLRMITGSFFVKDLIGDWKIGEKYFANNLIDYDVSLNNGGWQWVASTGTDSQPYFRIFNPSLQSEKFDKNCEFIKKWIPELKNVSNDHIHFWEQNYKKYKGKVDYFDPIVFHDQQKEKVLKLYKVNSKEDPDVEEIPKTESKKSVKQTTGKKESNKTLDIFTTRKRKSDSILEEESNLGEKLKKNQKKK